jgi:hypothetical protein
MQIKFIKILLLIFLATAAFSQTEKNDKPADTQKKEIQASEVNTTIPVQSKYSNNFKIGYIDFTKKVDLVGRGETIEFSFVIKSNLDTPQELYIWTIATHEKIEKTKSSFETIIEAKERLSNFSPFPDDIKAFEYPDKNIKDKITYIKFPKDPKNGVNPSTGNPYLLKDKLLVSTQHLSKYRVDYTFFNNFTLLIFDKDGKLVFRQLYDLKGIRK